MNKIKILLIVIWLSSLSFAQVGAYINDTFSTVRVSQDSNGRPFSVTVLNGGISNHSLTIVPVTGSPVFTMNLEGSVKGDFSDATVCATNSGNGAQIVSCTGVFQKVRINVTACTCTSASVQGIYIGTSAAGNAVVDNLTSSASGSNPTAGTAGGFIGASADVTGNLFVRTGGPNQFTCYARGVANALADFTQVSGSAGCGSQVPAGMKLYITDITAVSTTATASAFRLSFGTGAACVTTNNALFPANTSDTFVAPANTSAPLQISFNQPLVIGTTAQRICVISIVTQTLDISINGYIVP